LILSFSFRNLTCSRDSSSANAYSGAKAMSQPREIKVWWHGIPALPAGPQDHAYHALRRVWGDHTMAGNRGFYRVGSEDHITSALFQNWALFPDVSWAQSLLGAAGGTVGTVTRVQWAYECNERLDARLRPFHKSHFIIPDIMLVYEDENGLGLVAFEVKKPGKAAEQSDARKLMSYIDLPSTSRISRRYGCFLVSQGAVQQTRATCAGRPWLVLTWEQLEQLQQSAVDNVDLPEEIRAEVRSWIARHFSYFGIGAVSAKPPKPAGSTYGTAEGYRKIGALDIPGSVRRFLKGSECVEAVRNGLVPDPVFPWLVKEPTVDQIRERYRHQRAWQTSEDRYLCRWDFTWESSQERAWS
jgi:hypothetical protein